MSQRAPASPQDCARHGPKLYFRNACSPEHVGRLPDGASCRQYIIHQRHAMSLRAADQAKCTSHVAVPLGEGKTALLTRRNCANQAA